MRLLGGSLAAVCIGAVLIGYRHDLAAAARNVSPAALVVAIGTGGLFYGLLGLLLSTAWWRLLGPADARPRWIVGLVIWGSAQWAKYLPTNTLHYVGRQVLGRRYGLGQASVALSSTLEALSQVSAAALVAGCGRALEGELQTRDALLALAGVVGVFLILLIFERTLRRLPWTAGPMRSMPPLHDPATYRRIGSSVVLHVVFFLAVGTIGWLLAAGLFPRDASSTSSVFRVLWVFASAWLVGTLTIGAPAGAGVREGVLVLGLTPSLGGAAAVTVAIVLRAITVLGDGLVALGALLASTRIVEMADGEDHPPE